MDAFSFLSVLLSIILGLAITQVLQGLGRLMTARARVAFYWPPIVIALALLVTFVQSWWAMFGLRTRSAWTFLAFFVVILQTIFSYLQAALVLPEFPIESTVDMRANYFSHSRWLFLMLIGGLVTSLVKDVILDGRLPVPLNVGFHLSWIALSAVAAVTQRDWVHKIVAMVIASSIASYVVLLFARLQ
jgi:hypothetical protein